MNTRERIVDEALAELERSGVQSFSLRAVGAAVGITPMAIYRHFENKEDLLRAVGAQAFEQWQRRVARIRSADTRDWFRRSARAYIEFALDEPARFDACFVLRTRVERLYPQGFRERKSPAVNLMMERVEAAQAAGEVLPGDPLEIALFIWAQVHGLAMLHRSERFTLKRRAFLSLCDRCIDRALSVLMVPTPARARAR